VVGHDPARAATRIFAAVRVCRILAATLRGRGDGHEAIHAIVIDRLRRSGRTVRCSTVPIFMRRERPITPFGSWVRDARGDRTGASSEAFDAWVGAEVMIEGSILLHDDDDVPDLVDAGGGVACMDSRRR